MTINELFTEERAVSPVIGVILMVAITVILAAVIGTFVIGLGEGVGDTAPQASVDSEINDDDDAVFTHRSGDRIDYENLYVVSDGTRYGSEDGNITKTGEQFTSGSSITLNSSEVGDTITLVYDDGDQSTTLETLEK